MPIQLNNLQSIPSITQYNAKFFKSTITGTGGKAGLINENTSPLYFQREIHPGVPFTNAIKNTTISGTCSVTALPINALNAQGWQFMTWYERDIKALQDIGTTPDTVFAEIIPHTLVITEEKVPTNTGGSSTHTTLETTYQFILYFKNNNTEKFEQKFFSVSDISTSIYKLGKVQDNSYMITYTKDIYGYINNLLAYLPSFGINAQKLIDYVTDYSLYKNVCKMSEMWQTDIDRVISQFLENCNKQRSTFQLTLGVMCDNLSYLENYNVPLLLYHKIYQAIKAHFTNDPATLNILCKQNLNLLLSDTLNTLEQKAPILPCIKSKNKTMNLSGYSKEQQKAITTEEPLTIVQAGAGTGKSTTILGRIAYLISEDVDPQDITVLSFTNAAADNITNRNPMLNSSTIARMIHNIYTLNYPSHQLSTLETIMNSLEIYLPSSTKATELLHKLTEVKKQKPGAMMKLSNFIEENETDTMAILDLIGQTSLELEIIICYIQMETLSIPKNIHPKHLILDEVQDTSIFEFIYILKFTAKYENSLFIVGDASQTLYEFRDANPKALNLLEGTQVFSPYQLQVNYRSKQEILDFANIALSNIEANQYAQIQLQANSLSTVTEKSFTEAVTLDYRRLINMKQFSDVLAIAMGTAIKKWVDVKINAGEQVTFLAYRREDIRQISELLKKHYPDKVQMNLVSEKGYNNTVFSSFIKTYWSQIQFQPSKTIVSAISQKIMDKLQYLVSNHKKALPSVQKQLAGWKAEMGPQIDTWYNQYSAGTMTKAKFLTYIKESMLKFEIQNNAIKQSLLAQRNAESKKQNTNDAHFILSTIHGAKGLEFDNVVVIHKNENQMTEEKKRMYYVAFTRAKTSEYIFSYDTMASPQIESDYITILEQLNQFAPDPDSKIADFKDKNRHKLPKP